MQSNGLGIIELKMDPNVNAKVTNIERTLLDIAVRPFYAGGVFEVLEAYKRASTTVNVSQLVEMLRTMDYIYPYHQVIGFYLERSGCYKEKDINRLTDFGLNYDFYLTHQIQNPEYSGKWRLFIPKGF
jgi:predicted transcriptional regulator of viral defense system